MKNVAFYSALVMFYIFFASSTLKKNNQVERNINTTSQTSIKKIVPFGSAYCTIENQSSNTILKIVVNDVSGTHIYNNPILPLYIPTNGNVTITVTFGSKTATGGISTYEQGSGGVWNLTGCKDFYTSIVQIQFTPIGPEQYSVIISDSGC